MATILRVRTTLTYGSGGPGLHTSYWLPGTTGGVTADATDVVARVRGFFVGIAAQFPTSYSSQVQNDVAQINDSTGALVGSLTATPVAAVSGTGATSYAPLAAMALARLRTGLVVNGRTLKGRWYLGPVASSQISAVGGLQAAAVTAINGAGASLLAPGATTSALCVWHRPSATTGLSTGVTGISTWESVAVLRSRRDA